MSGTRLAHYLWVRWESGAVDTFCITPKSYRENRVKTPRYYALTSIDGEDIFVDMEKACVSKFFKKQINLNSLNDENHYDNPLN
jgi:hypothetical protein